MNVTCGIRRCMILYLAPLVLQVWFNDTWGCAPRWYVDGPLALMIAADTENPQRGPLALMKAGRLRLETLKNRSHVTAATAVIKCL